VRRDGDNRLFQDDAINLAASIGAAFEIGRWRCRNLGHGRGEVAGGGNTSSREDQSPKRSFFVLRHKECYTSQAEDALLGSLGM